MLGVFRLVGDPVYAHALVPPFQGTPLYFFLAGTLLLFLPGAWALHRARAEIAATDRISRTTFLAAYAAFTGHCIVVFAAAAFRAWPMPLLLSAGLAIGIPIFLAGALINIAGRRQFHSFRLMWGLDNNRLVTGGIYAWTRNPQTVGWLLMYIGMGMLGRSWAALALGGVFLIALFIWLPVEEEVLQRRFGEKYDRYRRSVPRFFRVTPLAAGGAAAFIEPKAAFNAETAENGKELRETPSESVL